MFWSFLAAHHIVLEQSHLCFRLTFHLEAVLSFVEACDGIWRLFVEPVGVSDGLFVFNRGCVYLHCLLHLVSWLAVGHWVPASVLVRIAVSGGVFWQSPLSVWFCLHLCLT